MIVIDQEFLGIRVEDDLEYAVFQKGDYVRYLPVTESQKAELTVGRLYSLSLKCEITKIVPYVAP